MPPLAAVKASNAEYHPSYLPVAVFVGATAGIGKCTAQSFAHLVNGRARIVIVGRNEAAAQDIIHSLPEVSTANAEEGGGYEFIPCDVTSMEKVHELTKMLQERLPKINFLVLSADVFSFRGWQETEDGLDRKMVLRYYSRWAFTNDLLPLLRKARDAGEDAKVMSILAAGQYSKIDLDDLGLKKSFGGLKAMLQSASYNDLMIAEFAERDPEISFIHAYPGWVDTFTIQKLDDWLVILFYPLLRLLSLFFSITPEVCAEYMLHDLLCSEKGVSRRNSKGDDIGNEGFPETVDGQRRLWEHSVEATKSTLT